LGPAESDLELAVIENDALVRLASVARQNIREQQMAVDRSKRDVAIAEVALEMEEDELASRQDQLKALVNILQGDQLAEVILNVLAEDND
jgi:hypothetical protein